MKSSPPPFLKSEKFLGLHLGRQRKHHTVGDKNVIAANVVFTKTTVTFIVNSPEKSSALDAGKEDIALFLSPFLSLRNTLSLTRNDSLSLTLNISLTSLAGPVPLYDYNQNVRRENWREN